MKNITGTKQGKSFGSMLEEVLNTVLPDAPPLRSAASPELVHFELTTRCPLRCPQCYCDLKTGKNMDRATLFACLDEAAQLKTKWIALSGGEALVYPYLIETLQHVHQLGMRATMATSGYGLTGERLEELKEAGIGWIFISLNGSTKEIHSLSRDGYQDGIRSLQLLRQTSLNYGINWVARQDNARDFPKVVELARNYGVKVIAVLRLKPDSGKDTDNYLCGPEYAELAHYLQQYQDRSPFIYVESCYPHLRTAVYSNNPDSLAGCQAGRTIMAVDVNGRMRPCRHLPYPQEYSSIKKYWFESEVLAQLRNTEENIEEPCKSCSNLSNCRTCRASCLKFYGSFYAGERRCPAVKKVKLVM
ncbi:MAG: hypothetical protein APF81_20185 [Desulfosporosinus sp. BRH_c37]|nr:MAG: hypothetical protein APF81_20185 [Desulfosporosinus sp. BRH_c37]